LSEPSEFRHYQREEMSHLIFVVPGFGSPLVELLQNFVHENRDSHSLQVETLRSGVREFVAHAKIFLNDNDIPILLNYLV
jgi:hypothetical protein